MANSFNPTVKTDGDGHPGGEWMGCLVSRHRSPAEDLLRLIREKEPDVVGLSVSVYFNMSPLKRMIETVRAHCANLDIRMIPLTARQE